MSIKITSYKLISYNNHHIFIKSSELPLFNKLIESAKIEVINNIIKEHTKSPYIFCDIRNYIYDIFQNIDNIDNNIDNNIDK